MFLLNINNTHVSESILLYIYKNKNLLLPEQNLNCIVNKIKNNEVNILLGYGIYKFKYEDTIIEIDYREEGNSKALEGGRIDYFKRFIIIGDDEETLKKFIIKALDKEEIVSNEMTDIFITNECGDWYKYNKIPARTLDSIYLDDEIKNKIINDLEVFKNSENEYNKFGIPYKRTYLLTGAPGMGKTSLVKAICAKYNYSLSLLSISKHFDNASLTYAIKDINDNSFLLLEDIDCLFEKRNVSQENPCLTFSNLINILDGVLYKHGIIIFMTTNHPEKLDNALLRIGRIDLILNINLPNEEMINKVFRDTLKNYYSKEEIKLQFISFYEFIKNKKIPMCAIVNFLFTYRNKWEKNIDELVNTDIFIKKTLKQDSDKSMYC
jgi:chaperone BCS1